MQKATGLKLSALVIATAKLLNKAMENLNKKIKKKREIIYSQISYFLTTATQSLYLTSQPNESKIK